MGDLTHFACGNVVTHCSNAIPTGQLRDDILKTTLIPSLLETYKPLDAGIVEHFFSFLKSSGHCQWRSIGLLYLSRDNFQSLPNPQELYIHHLKEWDQGWHRRLDKCPSDLLLASCIVLTDPEFPGAIQRLLNRILPPELVDSYAWPNFSYYSPLSTRTTVHARVDKIYYETGPKYHDMLLQFFMDPTRAGKHTLDGTKYATVAALFLRCISVSDSISQ